jgi:hypothetical protein
MRPWSGWVDLPIGKELGKKRRRMEALRSAEN